LENAAMPESIECSTVLPASPERVYRAWLNSAEHAAFTSSSAHVEPGVGGAFSAWDGYIRGNTLELVPYSRIVQAWRTSDFPPDSPPSCLEILLEPTDNGTRLTLHHSQIPDGQGQDYYQGWVDYYFAPMQTYFECQK
jgi:uncharacterized protein YndB with AHSA1/START domain